MSGLHVIEVDAGESRVFDGFYDAYHAAELAAGAGVFSPWMREEVRVMLREQTSRRWIGAFAGIAGQDVVAAGLVVTPLLDNLESADVAVHVAPGHRRGGHGTTMLSRLEEEARARGRRLLHSETAWSLDGGQEGAGQPGAEFARRHGFELGLGDVKRMVSLPVPEGLLERLAADAAQHHAAYELRSWAGPVPDDLIDGWARLTGTLITEAPMGEIERESEKVDAAVVREQEAATAKQGRTKYNTVALDADGEVVAYTDVAATVHEPGRAYQWGTLVRPDARGHRLGLAVKVANLRLLQRERPGLRTLVTYNAEVNRHMISVNEQLGFVPVARLGQFQKRL